MNEKEYILSSGTLVFIRAKDVHAFRSDQEGIVVNNVSIHPSTASTIQKRHFLYKNYFWNDSSLQIPVHHRLNPIQLTKLQGFFAELSHDSWDLFAAERFVLNLVNELRASSLHPTMQKYASLPEWLSEALTSWRNDPDLFIQKSPGLARHAGRSPEHVARVMRGCIGKTPTDLLNEMRMEHAARQLSITNRKVIDISMECGFESLGYFYTVFQRSFRCSPRTYRLKFHPRHV